MGAASNSGQYNHPSNTPMVFLATPAPALVATGYREPQQPGDNLLGELLNMLKSIFPRLEMQTSVEQPSDADRRIAFQVGQASSFHKMWIGQSFLFWI